MTAIPTRLAILLFLAPVFLFLTVGGADAQDDKWSFVVTPQVWISHIAKNGLVPASTFAGIEPLADPSSGNIVRNPFEGRNSSPVDSLNPQWGLQLAAQKDRWTLAGAFQYVAFETRADLFYVPSNDVPVCVTASSCLRPGERAAQEFVNTTRLDMDFAASYLFPDVVPNRLDLSLGGGVKVIYASASREFGNLSQTAAAFNGLTPPGLYKICSRDDCSDSGFRDRVKTQSWLYGATLPMSAVFHLTDDARWLMPLSLTPFFGAETRDDRDVVYAYNYDVPSKGNVTVNRLDGTTFAYGATADATFRWILSDTLSAYAGMRVQFIQGHEKFLAYGPLIGMSVRFGSK